MNHKYKIWTWLPAIIIMIMIYRFSASTGEQSSDLSTYFTETIVEQVIDIANLNLSPWEEMQIKDFIHMPLRKIGHLFEYAILALTIAFPLYVYHKKRRWGLVLWCEGICFIYACTDEIHQLFVAQRSGQFSDVLIDSLGALFGIFGFYIILTLSHKFTGSKVIRNDTQI